ncbi:TPA: HlyD family efflux transporter periplasmic adaptor subunit [Pseudomonas aeruginosa]|uniref:HlyD family secretion protein n=1 Tax=Pseudomonas aeruginosa TaxID=287 RepID=UPI000451E9B5|nr:HlyD family efflux transporter periplasmic adaptor subunit [Pseudomonas aeruginosa]EYU01617.1 Membrane fusion component of tripartite multidrug resistance system [Pseudomonas aeruginosa PA99]MBO3770492.1 HlyD family efflux transporter periplasmic adaptor subunit [Pseudomonas aeruginosa]MCD2807657.1 HlyD family efflux transporter periplasmic adaptor subunit [Pseudomonas aeruginosa]MCH0754087.1 HlyD family efflux transporter periplasmic adaptor subunit [Pseudomonas aeruginosa]MCR6601921.1 Hly
MDNKNSTSSISSQLESGVSPVQDGGKGIWLFSITVVAVLVALAVFWYYYELNVERTEDAQVNGNVVQVTAQIDGTVVAIHADDTDYVKAGSSLVVLNSVDQEIIYEKARAALAKAARSVRSQYLQVSEAKANLARVRTDVLKAKADLARRMKIASIGAFSREEISHAENALKNALAAQDSTKQLLSQRLAQVDNTVIRSHPDVVAAAASLREAYISKKRTIILAPVDGTVTKRSVQVGQHIGAGVALMSVVPLNDLWVTANFKESQLKDIRIGQPVKLTADIYGDDVVYHGEIVGLDAGTGSAFSLFPAQNATGNWIKVTQRVPVKVSLDPSEVARSPLRVGLSMHVVVDTSNASGKVIRTDVALESSYHTQVFDNELNDANEEVEEIIRANEGSVISASKF